MESKMTNAEIIVIGGGAVGCGVAYSLAKAGHTDILLIERAADVGQVTTMQGAGLCGQARPSLERIRRSMHVVATFRELQKDPDVRPNWNECGSLRIALSDRRADELRELERFSQEAGLEAGLISIEEGKRRWPPMDFSGVKSVFWVPSDGSMTPYMVAKSYEHQCRKIGVRFATNALVEAIDCKNGRVEAVRTSQGRAECKYVINAAGAHAYHVAKLVGLELPIVPVRHEYFVTVAIDGLHPSLPTFRVPELTLYGRVANGGLLLGGWETKALGADPRGYSLAEPAPPLSPDWAVLNDFEERFTRLFPQARGAAKNRVGIGWPTFTPDGNFILGESRRVPGFVMAGGCNAHGISGSAGIGKMLVQALFDPNPPAYVRGLSPDRFTESSWNWDDARRQARQVYETYYGTEG
jgi:glycine/D-amino acid oxidase-like deaminating enzyme